MFRLETIQDCLCLILIYELDDEIEQVYLKLEKKNKESNDDNEFEKSFECQKKEKDYNEEISSTKFTLQQLANKYNQLEVSNKEIINKINCILASNNDMKTSVNNLKFEDKQRDRYINEIRAENKRLWQLNSEMEDKINIHKSNNSFEKGYTETKKEKIKNNYYNNECDNNNDGIDSQSTADYINNTCNPNYSNNSNTDNDPNNLCTNFKEDNTGLIHNDGFTDCLKESCDGIPIPKEGYPSLLDNDDIKLLQKWIGSGISFNLSLIYKASVHGYESSNFHKLCNKQGPTIVVCLNEHNYRFGGYSLVNWNSTEERVYRPDKNGVGFLFSLNASSFKLGLIKKTKAVCNFIFNGPTFGEGWDMFIGDRCSTNKISYTNLGGSYEGAGRDKQLTGCEAFQKFFIKDYEVYRLLP